MTFKSEVSAIAPTIQLAISPHFHNKENRSSKKAAFSRDWITQTLTPQQIADHVTSGGAICVAALKDDHRISASFQSAQIIGGDLDNGPDVATLLTNPFIRDHAFLVYASPSSTPEAPRSRVFFILDEAIGDPKLYQTYIKRLIAFLATQGIQADKACTDAIRMFYGSTQPNFSLRPDKVLTLSVLEALPPVQKRTRSSQRKAPSPAGVKVSTSNQSALSDLIASALACIPPQGEYETWLFILMAVHSVLPDKQGIDLIEAWSPGKEGEVADKFDSFHAPDETSITLDFLWSVARSYGWQEAPALVPDLQVDLPRLSYMSLPRPGVYLIKSPMASGKTYLAGELIQQFPKRFGRTPRVIVLTHRVALGDGVADRLHCEIYHQLPREFLCQAPQLVCTPNSIHKLLEVGKKLPDYDIIIIDEVEQLLTHLVGDTFKGSQGVTANVVIRQLIGKAKYVLALDAHAGQVAYDYLQHQRADVTFIENTTEPEKKNLEMVKHYEALLGRMRSVIWVNGVFVILCDEKTEVEKIATWIDQQWEGELVIRVIHSDNSDDPDTRHFIRHINEELPKVNVLICSPTLGTGVDIQVPVDAVFGIFHGKTITPEEQLQMLGRCRQAEAFYVYQKPIRHQLPTDADQLYDRHLQNLLDTGLECAFDTDGTYGPNAQQRDYLRLYSNVTAARNRSMNAMRERFLYLAHQTYLIQWFNEWGDETIQAKLADLETRLNEEARLRLLVAQPISREDYLEAKAAGQVDETVQAGHLRWQIEDFYGQPLTEAVMDFHDDGHGRTKLLEYIRLFQPLDLIQALDREENQKGIPYHLRHHYAIRQQLLRAMLGLIYPHGFHTVLMPEADFLAVLNGPFTGYIEAEGDKLHRFLNRRFNPDDSPLKLLRYSHRLVGLSLKRERKGKRKGQIFYQLSAESYVRMHSFARTRLTHLNEVIDLSANPFTR